MNWLDSFKLTLNIDKTHYIAFSITAANRPEFDTINHESLTIKEVPFTKYLGIIIDKHLKWDQHVLKLTSNIRKLIHTFYLLRDILNKNLLINIYKSLIESLIRYGIIVWGGLYRNSLKQLNVVQNYILKVMYRKRRRYSTDLLYSEEIFNVRSLYVLSACIYVHKSLDLKVIINHSYETRGKVNKHLEIPNVNKSINQRFVNYLAPKFYNIIPDEIKQIFNTKSFSKRCRSFIYENADRFRF